MDELEAIRLRARARKRKAEAERGQGGGLNGAAHVAMGGLIEGIPIAGPYIREGADRVGAGIRSWMYDTPFQDELDFVQGRSQQLSDERPILDTASKITGAVAGTVPMVMAAPAAFGAGGGSLGARTVASGLSGAVIGGADSAVRSDGDLRAAIRGAIIGGGTGLAAPLAGKAIGTGVQKFRDWRAAGQAANRTGMGRGALGRLGRAVRDDGLDAASLAQRAREIGPDAMVMDMGPNLQQQAGGLASLPGRPQEIIRGGVRARDAAANSRIMGALDDTLGPSVIPSQVDDVIRANQQSLSPAYEQVFRGARRVDTTPIAESLESASVRLRGPAQKAAQEVRRMLNVIGTDQLDPNPQTLFQTRQAIDGLLANNADPNAIRLLSATRQQVDDALARSVPGIKNVDAQFAELARQREALTRGQQVLDSGRTAPRPAELAQEFAEGALPQGHQVGPSAVPMRLREGARAEMDRIVGTNANDRVALQRLIKGEGDWNRSRLATLFGKDKADRIIGVLDRERLFSETSDVVTRNSLTASRQAAQREIAGGSGAQFGAREGYMAGGVMGAARSAGVRTFEGIRDAIMGAHQQARNVGMAEALASRDVEAVARALMQAQGAPVNREAVDQIARALLIGGGTAAGRP